MWLAVLSILFEMAQNVKSVFIDEEGKYDLHSDHVIISADLELNNKSINCNDPKGLPRQ
jgi:hypothetical protein